MDPGKQRQIASMGGKKVHALGRAHEWNHEEAVAAGRKGPRHAKKVSDNSNT